MAFASINTSATNNPTAIASIPAIEEAFAAEPSLKKRVYDAIGTTPQHYPLFEDIARYTSSLLVRNADASANITSLQAAVAATASGTTTTTTTTINDGPAAKKRKLQNGDNTPGEAQSSVNVKADASLQFYMQDVSFAIPQRKKLLLEMTAGRSVLRARNQTSKEVEFGIALDKIRHVLCLPVPEKNQKQFNFCIIPQYADGVNAAPEGEPTPDCIVWTVNDGPAKAAYSGTGQQIGNTEGETAEGLVRRILNENLSRTKVVRPDERQFVSAMPEAHRKGEKAYHVKAFRGSKEGYLFLLSTGILFGFKKPLVFFAFENVESISYTSVLQRTFNLNVVAQPTAGDEKLEFEFSMIDQADFAGIDSYIKTHGLQDASLAEARRAKKYNINGAKTEDDTNTGTGQVGAEDEESELQKAQREIEDQEDEEEEDYDPGSDDDTDGTGSSSEEDEDGDGDGDDDEDDEEHDLVADELGSEVEDVPADDDEL